MGKVYSIVGVVSSLGLLPDKVEELFDKQKDFILSVMPEGTKFVGYKETMIVDLSIKRVYEFEHPSFEDQTRLELYYSRSFYKDEVTDKLVSFNLFKGLDYFDKDGNKRYLEEIGNSTRTIGHHAILIDSCIKAKSRILLDSHYIIFRAQFRYVLGVFNIIHRKNNPRS